MADNKTRTYSIGVNRGRPRLWLEGTWLADAGFPRGAAFKTLADQAAGTLTLTTHEDGDRHVSGKTKGARQVSIIDINMAGLDFLGSSVAVTVARKGRIVVSRA
jgi:DNA (cytosine-5)-methyltransferase 1